MPFVDDRQHHLALGQDVKLSKFEAETFLIGRLQKAWAELPMNLDRCTDHQR
jgi:hypothetical protein